MTTIYACNITGAGTPSSLFEPAGFAGMSYACLMMDTAKGRCILLSPSDTVTGAGITALLTSASHGALVTDAGLTAPSAAKRTALAAWLVNAGYLPLTAAQVTWLDCVHHVVRQVNSAADLALTRVG